MPADWPHLTGFAAHWDKNANFAAAFDKWFLNLFPQEKPYVFNGGGYQTLNFVPAIATMLFGLSSGAALATVVGVLIEVPVMLMPRRWMAMSVSPMAMPASSTERSRCWKRR